LPRAEGAGFSHGKQTELLWGISFGQGTQKLPTPLDLALYLAPSLVQDVELLSVELLHHLVQTGVAVLAALTDTDDLATLHEFAQALIHGGIGGGGDQDAWKHTQTFADLGRSVIFTRPTNTNSQ
jgi:hypothetical protein